VFDNRITLIVDQHAQSYITGSLVFTTRSDTLLLLNEESKATIYVCEIMQQLTLGYIVRGVHIVMFTMSFVNSLLFLCGPPT
jgi:hypothetical protein